MKEFRERRIILHWGDEKESFAGEDSAISYAIDALGMPEELSTTVKHSMDSNQLFTTTSSTQGELVFFPTNEVEVTRDFSQEDDLIFRLRKRAEIRRQIPSRKSVQEGREDRLAALLEEAADSIEKLKSKLQEI